MIHSPDLFAWKKTVRLGKTKSKLIDKIDYQMMMMILGLDFLTGDSHTHTKHKFNSHRANTEEHTVKNDG